MADSGGHSPPKPPTLDNTPNNTKDIDNTKEKKTPLSNTKNQDNTYDYKCDREYEGEQTRARHLMKELYEIGANTSMLGKDTEILNNTPRTDLMEIIEEDNVITPEDERLLDSSQESIHVVLNNMSLKENEQDKDRANTPIDRANTPIDELTAASTRRSARNMPRKNYQDVHAGKDTQENRPSDDRHDNPDNEERNKPTKKKKKTPKRTNTETEQIQELKKIIELNEDVIEEDETRIKFLENTLKNTTENFESLTLANECISQENERLRAKLEAAELMIRQQQETIRQLQQQHQNRDEQAIEHLKRQLNKLDNICIHQRETINDHEAERQELQQKIKDMEELLETMRRRNTIQEKRIAQIKRTASASSDEEKQLLPYKKTKQDTINTHSVTPQTRNDKEMDDIREYRESIRAWTYQTTSPPKTATSSPKPQRQREEPRAPETDKYSTIVQTLKANTRLQSPQRASKSVPAAQMRTPPSTYTRHHTKEYNERYRETPPSTSSASKPNIPTRPRSPPTANTRQQPQESEQKRTPPKQTQQHPQTRCERRPRIGLIMDSNGRGIANEFKRSQYINETDYTLINDYRTIEDLQRIPRHDQIIEELRQYDQIVIMIGTNNIKRGDEPTEAANEFNKTVMDIARRTNTGIKTVEIPPIDPRRDPKGAQNAETFNRIINRPSKHIKLRRLRGEPLKNILNEDGIHLSEEGTAKAAKDIHEVTLKANSLETQRKTQLDIPPEVISHIIGRKGSTIRRYEDQFQVRIIIDNNTAIIRGAKRREAAQAIREDIETAQMRTYYD